MDATKRCGRRRGLDDLLNVARKGDTIAIWRLDRLARSLEHLIELANRFAAAEISFVSLTEGFDTSKPSGKMIFQIIGAIAEFERNLIVERTRAGLESAKAQGKYGGRKPVLNDDKKNVLRDLLFENGRTLKQDPDYRSAARAVGVSERTVRRYAQGEYAEPV